MSEAVLSALSYIDDANSNCSALCGKMANLIVTIPDEKISELMERTTSIIEKLGQDTTRLGNATVKGQAEKAKTKYLIENHVWKKHEIVKVLLGDAKRQIREVKSTIVTLVIEGFFVFQIHVHYQSRKYRLFFRTFDVEMEHQF